MQSTPIKSFKKLSAFKTFAKKHNLKLVKVSTSKTNQYWQARRNNSVVGMFNTGLVSSSNPYFGYISLYSL